MIDLVTLHSDETANGNLMLMIFHNVKITGYIVNPDGSYYIL